VIRFLATAAIVSFASSAMAFPDDDYISYGCHGGFTGGGGSTVILIDGRIYQSRRATFESKFTEPSYIGKNLEAARELFLASDRVDFLGSPTPKAKSHYCVIAKRISGQAYGILVNQKDTPDAAQALVDLFVKLVFVPDESSQ